MILTHYAGKELARILGKNKKNIKRIEEAFNVKLSFKENNIEISSPKKDTPEEYIASKALEALSLGFNIETVVALEDITFCLKVIDLKGYAHGSRLSVVVGRIIGKEGKSKRVLETLSGCEIVISEHYVGIMGKAESVEIASEAIEKLIRGSEHANVFKFLEKSQKYLREQDELVQELEEEQEKN